MATPSSSMPAPEAPASIGPVGRIIGALFSPKKTFADIAQKPSWLGPMVLLTVLSLGVSALLAQKVDWHSFMERQLSKNPRIEQMPADQKERIIESQAKYAPAFSYAIGLLGPILGTLLIGFIYWGAFNLFSGAGLKYGTAFGITSHAFVPSAIASVLALVTILLKARGDVDPENLLASSLSAFLPENASKWLHSLGKSIEVFWIWCLILLAIGFAAANPKKIKSGNAFGIVFGLWALWVLIKVAWAAI
jgi:Yip1 domain